MPHPEISVDIKKAFDSSADNSNLVHLSNEAATNFVDLMKDQSVVLKRARVESVGRATKTLGRIVSTGEFFRDKSESINWDDSSLQPIDIALYEIRGEFRIYDSEKRHSTDENLDTKIINMIAKKAANSLETLALNSDKALVTGPIINRKFNGFLKRIKTSGQYLDATNTGLFADAYIDRAKLVKMVKSLPTEFRESAEFFMHNNALIDYVESLATNYNRNELIDNILGLKAGNAPLMTVDGSNNTSIILTNPLNLIFAISTDAGSITFEKFRNAADRCDEYYFTMEVDFQIEAPDAAVLLEKAKIR